MEDPRNTNRKRLPAKKFRGNPKPQPTKKRKRNQETETSDTENHYPAKKNSYQLGEVIGKSVGATVYKATCKKTKKSSSAVAIKIIPFDNRNPRRVSNPTDLPPHQNILKRHRSFVVSSKTDHNSRWVVMPYICGGSLQSIMASLYTDGIPEKCLTRILEQVLLALAHLHRQGFFHGNIKPGNILVDEDGTVKLADNGESSSSHILFSAAMQYWLAPEVNRHVYPVSGYGKEADIWSLGVTALELAHGRPPLSHIPTPAHKVLRLKIEERFRFFDPNQLGKRKSFKNLSEDFKDVVLRCLVKERLRRENAEDLLKHRLFKNGAKDVLIEEDLLAEWVRPLEKRLERLSYRRLALGPYIAERKCITRWEFNEKRMEFDPVFGKDMKLGEEV